MRARLRLPAVLVFVGSLVSCGTGSGDLVLSLEDSGRTITLERGQIVAVPLEMNSSVGFEWDLREPPDEGILRLLSNEVEVDAPDVVGGGGVQTWRFEAVGEGRTELILERRYRGEEDPDSLEFRLEVRVDAPSGVYG
jgi:inhibitor of cysteine peptidase